MEQPEYMITSDVSILLLLVAVGVFLIVRVSTINGSYDMLLQEGEYSQKEKAVKKSLKSIQLLIGVLLQQSILDGVS